MSMDEELNRSELVRVITRGQQARHILSQRLASVEIERAELMAIVDELQTDLATARQQIEMMQLASASAPVVTSTDPHLADNGHPHPPQMGVTTPLAQN